MRIMALLAALCMAPHAAALETRDATGLDVAIEPIAEPIEVDGLPLTVRRATGPGVAILVLRIGERWLAAGAPVRRLSQGGWQMLSRWDGGHAELLQWRGEGATAELLYSRFDARRRPTSVGAPPLHLPVRCAWGRQVAGKAAGVRYQQLTARCRGTAAALMPDLRVSLNADGWQWQETAPGALQVARGASRGMLILVPGRNDSDCWLAWVGTLSGERE